MHSREDEANSLLAKAFTDYGCKKILGEAPFVEATSSLSVFQEAIKHLSAITRSSLTKDDIARYDTCYTNMGFLYSFNGLKKPAEELECFTKAVEWCKKVPQAARDEKYYESAITVEYYNLIYTAFEQGKIDVAMAAWADIKEFWKLPNGGQYLFHLLNLAEQMVKECERKPSVFIRPDVVKELWLKEIIQLKFSSAASQTVRTEQKLDAIKTDVDQLKSEMGEVRKIVAVVSRNTSALYGKRNAEVSNDASSDEEKQERVVRLRTSC